jgi:hypothetical protein
VFSAENEDTPASNHPIFQMLSSFHSLFEGAGDQYRDGPNDKFLNIRIVAFDRNPMVK